MLYIYGNSHADYNFRGLDILHHNRYQHGITMHRIGRDKRIPQYTETTSHDIVVFVYGEVDCRRHINLQIQKGRDEDEIIDTVVKNYFLTISNIVRNYKAIIIHAINPTTDNEIYYNNNNDKWFKDSILNMFCGTNEDRVRYTEKMNNTQQKYCKQYGYLYFDPHDYYKNQMNCMKDELSDKEFHILNNQNLLEDFKKFISCL